MSQQSGVLIFSETKTPGKVQIEMFNPQVQKMVGLDCALYD